MSRLHTLLTVAAAGGLAIAAAAPVSASSSTVARWEMNEPAGAHTMKDSSGHNRNGSFQDVTTGATFDGATGYRFSYAKPNQPPANPGRVVQVPNDSSLNPGTRNFSITVTYRTTHSFGNLIQKGQSGAKGGYFKIQLPNGIAQCLFRGASGSIAVGSGRALNDGQWHTLHCQRTSTAVTMTVDGKVTGKKSGATGTISNSSPLTIAGKLNCDQVKVTCDYFAGDVDRVQLDAG
jgi:Laminin G domain